MAITASDIHNQSFSIDRKGYDVDEVDVFLEHVADEIDALNARIEELEDGEYDDRFDGFDAPVAAVACEEEGDRIAELEALLAEKDEQIADLAHQLELKKADDKAIAQALIIAQRSADEILVNANAKSAAIIQDAKEEAERILNKVEGDRQEVIDEIKKLEDDREDAREEYQELLKDFITDATRKLAEIGGDFGASVYASAHARPSGVDAVFAGSPETTGRISAQAPIKTDAAPAYATPQTGSVVVAAATPTPSYVQKDLSGFGDADDDFEFEELD